MADTTTNIKTKKPRKLYKNKNTSRVDRNEMVRLRMEGKSLDELGSIWGVSRERIRQLLKEEGAAGPLRYQPHTDPAREIAQLAIKARAGTTFERWEQNVDVVQGSVMLTPCHIWRGSKNPRGYARVGIETDRRRKLPSQLLHRILWIRRHGPLGNKFLANLCGDKACLNLDHWLAQTKEEFFRTRKIRQSIIGFLRDANEEAEGRGIIPIT